MTIHPQPKPDSRKYSTLIANIEEGVIKIPKFQREFVWPIEKTAALLDSIVKGYPIGTFILWKTNQRMADVKNVGNIPLPATPEGRQIEYVLDGQQRMTSLFAAYRGAKIARIGTNRVTDFEQIYVNLDPTLPNDAQIVVHELPEAPHKCVSLKDILSLNRTIEKQLVATLGLTDEDLDTADKFKQAFATYDFSLVTLTREDVDSAIEVFTRINTGGSVLTVFEIMVAKTYDEEQGFDMQDKWQEVAKDFAERGYDGISPSIMLQLLSLVLSETGDPKRATILSLDKNAIIKTWPLAVDALESAVDHFRTAYRIPVSALLPYDTLLVPFAYWFYKNKREPVGDAQLRMREFFWRAALSSRYSSAVESALAADKRAIDAILAGKPGTWSDLVAKTRVASALDLIGMNFATGNAVCKAILCLLADEQPRNFHNDGTVLLDNSFLKIASSKNYHHFFPKDFLKTQGIGNENSVVNITLIGADLNKRMISARAPSAYIASFEKTNPTMASTLRTHLINRKAAGIEADDYAAFLQQRSAAMWLKLDARINPVFLGAVATAEEQVED